MTVAVELAVLQADDANAKATMSWRVATTEIAMPHASPNPKNPMLWGQKTLSDHIPAYQPLAFSPPYGSYGQDGTNDARIPDALLDWLTHRYDVIFTQDVNARAQPRARQPLGRIQVTRATTAGSLHEMLLSGRH